MCMKKILFTISCLLMLLLAGCKSKQATTSTSAYHGQETECVANRMDGKMVLCVWASGSDRADAVEQAKKKAVYDVTFTGITAGNASGTAYPVVDEAGARTKYREYFDRFFIDGGAYTKYVDMYGSDKSDIKAVKGSGGVMYSVTVVVDRSALKKRFEDDNVIIK